MLILSGQSDVSAEAVKIGPNIIFERLWKETGIYKAIKRLLQVYEKDGSKMIIVPETKHREAKNLILFER